jgi:hypothetical protein
VSDFNRIGLVTALPLLIVILHMTLLAIAVRSKGRSSYRVARTAGSVHCLRHPMIGLFVIDGLARLRENLGVAGVALVLHPLIVLAMCKCDVAVLGLKYDGFRGHARR